MCARILVVDDEPSIRSMLNRALVRDGHDTSLLGDAESALDLLAGDRFDLLLLDIRLPGMSGLELAAELRARGVDTPIILVTADPSYEGVRDALGMHAADYLTKPVDPGTVRLRVRRALDGKRLRDENARYRIELERRLADLIAIEQARETLGKFILGDLTGPLQELATMFEAILSADPQGRPAEETELIASGLERVRGMRASAARLTELCLISRGRRWLRKETVSLAALLAKAAEDPGGPGLDIDLEAGAAAAGVDVEEGLIISAIRAVLEDLRVHGAGVVRAAWREETGRGCLTLAAPGPPADRAETILATDPLAGVGSGAGAGLAFARSVLEVHGGGLDVGGGAEGERVFILIFGLGSEQGALG